MYHATPSVSVLVLLSSPLKPVVYCLVNRCYAYLLSLLHLVFFKFWPLILIIKDYMFAATDPASTSGRSQGSRSPGVVVGNFNISEQDGTFSDLSRVSVSILGTSILSFGELFLDKRLLLCLSSVRMTYFPNPFSVYYFQILGFICSAWFSWNSWCWKWQWRDWSQCKYLKIRATHLLGHFYIIFHMLKYDMC